MTSSNRRTDVVEHLMRRVADREVFETRALDLVQARNTYVEYLDAVGGRRFLVTMEEPTVAKPQPIVFEISGRGGKLALTRSGTVAIVSSPAPRAG